MSASVTGGWDYVAGGYGATTVLLGGYVASLLRRRRVLARRLRVSGTPVPAAGEALPADGAGGDDR